MTTDTSPARLNLLLAAAAAVIVISGLKAAATILIPLLLAVFISIINIPFLRWMVQKKVPKGVAVAFIILILMLILFSVASFLGGTVNAFYKDIPVYERRFRSLILDNLAWAQQHGIVVTDAMVREYINPGQVMGAATSLLNSLRGLLTSTLLIMLIIMFILLEASGFPDKVKRAFGNGTAALEHFRGINRSIQRYLLIKTGSSIATGILVWLILFWLEVPYPSLWAVTAFLLNYIPTIGSIVAAIPALIMALIANDPMTAGIVTIWYIVVNTLIGSIIEPRLMGKSLGISPMVVFLSLIFWGWLWGPIGMILSVPLTMGFKIAMEANPSTVWLATLLDP
jgi:AI-2 transport protein TqsA